MGSAMNILKVDYASWKAVVQANGFQVYHKADGDYSRISYAGNKDYLFCCEVPEESFPDYATNFESGATVIQKQSEVRTAILGTHIPEAKSQPDGAAVVAIEGRIGKEVIYASHNYCDVETWYSESARVTDESLTDNAGTWEAVNQNWICICGGKIMDEDAISEDQTIFEPGDPHGYKVKVVVDGTEKTMRLPLETTGGDYTVDYAAGTVTPITEDWTGLSVVCSYSHATTSGWIIRPLPGKALVIVKSEVQFSQNIGMNAAIKMEAFGNVTYFAPTLAVSGGGQIPDGTPVPIETTYYRSLDQLIDEAIAAFPLIPALSSGTNRGFSQDRIVFQFFYGAAKGLFDSLGMFIRISLVGDEPFTGERATATFYCNSKSDPGVSRALEEVLAE